MLVRESLYNFKRESDPVASSGLGVRNMFGFGVNLDSEMLNNIGDVKSLYLTPEFAKNVLEESPISFKHFKKKFEFSAVYQKIYKCEFSFKETKVYNDDFPNGRILYRVIGSSGSHGFNGGQSTKRETFCKRDIKAVQQ